MFRMDRGSLSSALLRVTIAAFVMSLGPAHAVAEAKEPAAKGQGKAASLGAGAPVPQPAYVPIEKPDGTQLMPMRRTQMADRMNAAIRAQERRRAAEEAQKAKQRPPREGAPAGGSALHGVLTGVLRLAIAQTPPPDLYNSPNYALTKLPTATCSATPTVQCQKDSDCPGYKDPIVVGVNIYAGGETCTGPVVAGTGIRKFVDGLAPLCPLGKNNLQNCLPLATPDTTTFPGSDYYEIGLKDYTYQFHSDLPPTTQVRGYYQKNAPAGSDAAKSAYLGPVIVARSYRPVRAKLVNELPAGTAGDLFIPTDTSVAGSGDGPTGVPFTNNRAAVHLHGGNTPWITDGTQHQWTAPVTQTKADSGNEIKGWSVAYVPDMWFDSLGNPIPECSNQTTCGVTGASNDPGPGMLSFYWPNEQSGRLEFYHDHAYGITRLNVYAGEAAGYLVVHPPDEDALAAATVPGTIGTKMWDPQSPLATATAPDLGHMIPLVIQDKTFVPPAAQLAAQDPTWDVTKWGGEGNFWFPHVYTPNQWPENPDGSGTNPFGRWDYGPWFWPPQTSFLQVDWKGTPTTLSGAQLLKDCTTMLGVPAGGTAIATKCPITPDVSLVPESFLDTPVINGVAYPTLNVEPAAYRFQMLNAAQERNWNLSWFVADASGTEVPMVPADPHGPLGAATVNTSPPLCDPSAPLSTVTGLPFGPDLPGVPVCWPTTWPVDSRQGGVPDPAAAGPQWIQIGSEGGILPAPAFIPPTPVGYEMNKRNIVVLNIAIKGLFMGPAERADVIVDFSAYAGKTLILYNDAPAPVPAGDPRQDYWTGAPDQTISGGAPTTLPGYGPNVRTIMQVKVAAAKSTPQPALDVAAVTTALAQRFKISQPPPIVPESAYNAIYAPTTPYTDTYLPIQATALTFTPVGETNPTTLNLQWKALHELFTTESGRMNSLLASEIPNTSWLNQTTIPFTNFDPATEFITDNQPQIWKVTHNGVDTHTIHFHLLNAQIVNRVGWDGQVRPPDANELGWKESVRMNPLEDIYIALRPVKQNLPWPIPDKWRPLDVVRALDTSTQFTGVDIYNNPIQVKNQMVNFGWEYVWHCHLLGHEEEDMLRAEVFVVAPEVPSNLVATQAAAGQAPVISWRDESKSALSFTLQRADDANFTTPVEFKNIPATATQPGPVSIQDGSATTGGPYFYRVRAEKELTSPARPGETFPAFSSWSTVAQLGSVLGVGIDPLTLTFPDTVVKTTSVAQTVTVTTTGAGAIGLGVTVIGTNPGDFAVVNGCPATQIGAGTCTLSVTFTPTAAGARAATLVVSTSEPATYSVALQGNGAAPVATVNPTALAFGNQLVGSSAAQTITVTNSGAAPLTVSGVTVAGTNAGDFTTTNGCTAPVPPTAGSNTCTVTVTFTPTASGVRSARVAISSNDPVSPTITVPLSGTGTAGQAGVSPAALTFSNELLNTTSPAQTVTVTNSGTATLTVNTVTIGGAAAAEYALVANGCANATVAVGGSCTFGVTFTPTTTGQRLATVTISSAAPAVNPTLTVSLTGTVIAPSASITPTSLTFPVQTTNTTSAPQIVTLSNSGPPGATLFITGVTTTGDFAAASGCGASLAGGTFCTISVTFRPTAAGARTGSVTILSSDPLRPTITATLSGTGTTVDLSPTALSFGDQAVGTQSSFRNVTIVNTGTATLTITSVAVTGTNAADYTFNNNCGTTVAAGRSCTISIRFAPRAAGASTATLSVATNDPASPSTVALSGNGTAPVASVSPSALLFTSSILVASASQPITLTNTGTAPLTFNGVNLGGTNADQFTETNNCPQALAVAASCTIDVVFFPTASTPLTKTATVTVQVGAPAASPSVTLTGTILVPTYTMAPNPLVFPKQPVNTTSAPLSITVTNTGAVPLSIRGVSLGGNNPGNFAQTNNCGTALAGNSSCTIDVTFTPSNIGTRTATLTLRARAPGVSQTVNLSGIGN